MLSRHRWIRRDYSRVLILSMHQDESYVLGALNAGAKGYLLKDSMRKEVIEAIRVVAQGRSYLTRKVGAILQEDYIRDLRERGLEDSYELLTEREREVLQLIAEGRANKEVANILNVSVTTVETHRGHILQKLRPAQRSGIDPLRGSQGHHLSALLILTYGPLNTMGTRSFSANQESCAHNKTLCLPSQHRLTCSTDFVNSSDAGVMRGVANQAGFLFRFFRDRRQCIDEQIQFAFALGLGRLDHQRSVHDQRETHRVGMESVIDQTLGDHARIARRASSGDRR